MTAETEKEEEERREKEALADQLERERPLEPRDYYPPLPGQEEARPGLYPSLFPSAEDWEREQLEEARQSWERELQQNGCRDYGVLGVSC
jgi:hypothetical protein